MHPERGTVDVVIFDGLGIERKNLEIPWSGFSMNGHRSSWVRYMPQMRAKRGDNDVPGGDLVYVAFTIRGEARIIGFATWPGDYDRFERSKVDKGTKMPKGDFAVLKQGEWDLRSCGGAYIYGQKDGQLLLAAGPLVQARFNKVEDEGRLEASLWKFGGAGSFVKIGAVKRQITGELKERNLSALDPTATKEFYVHLENTLSAGASVDIADYEFGAVRNSLGVPVVGSVGSPPALLRERKTIYNVDGLTESYKSEIDVLGNHHVSYGTTATKIQIDGGAPTDAEVNLLGAELNTTAGISLNSTLGTSVDAGTSVSVSAGTTVDVQANLTATIQALTTLLKGSATATVEGALVMLGQAAVQPAVHSIPLGLNLAGLAALAQTMAGLEKAPIGDPKGLAWQTFATLIAGILAQPPGPSGLLSMKVLVE